MALHPLWAKATKGIGLKRVAIPVLVLAALAACDGAAPDGDRVREPATTQDPAGTPQPTGMATSTPTSAVPAVSTIPSAIQGRWGLVAADCEPGRSDAKGLLIISGSELEFYESVGTLGAIEDASAAHIRADFDFTGEGMNWQRDLLLERDGNTLTRREYGGEGAGPFRYTKCN